MNFFGFFYVYANITDFAACGQFACFINLAGPELALQRFFDSVKDYLFKSFGRINKRKICDLQLFYEFIFPAGTDEILRIIKTEDSRSCFFA